MAKQADGRYRAKVTVGIGANGKSIVKYVSGRTKKELEAAKERVKAEYVSGRVNSSELTFAAYALQWYEVYKVPKLGISAKKSYQTTFYKHIFPAIGDKRLTAISAMDLQALLNSKADCCATIIENVRGVLCGTFKRAYADGVIPRDITVGLEKPEKSKTSRRALTEAETAAAKILMQEQDGLLVALLYYTGMRLGEVCGLQWQHVDFKDGVIHVRQQINLKSGEIAKTKTEKSVRDIPLADPLSEMLFPLRGTSKAFVFPAPDGRHYKNSSINRLWKNLMHRMYEIDPNIEAIDGISMLTPHYFRHNYASILYNSGIDVLSAQEFLGHTSAKTTLEIYSHLSELNRNNNIQQVKAVLK